MEHSRELHAVSDDELIRRLQELVTRSHRLEADLVAHIGEVDERRLYARQAFPSMFAYCTEALHLSEAEAYRRITVARAARKHQVLLTMLRDGRVHLTGAALLAPLLTEANHEAILARATHRTKRQIEELVAELAPRPDAPAAMRKLPQNRGTATEIPAQRGADWQIARPGGERPADAELVPGPAAAAADLELVPGRVGREIELDPPSAAVSESVVPLSPGRYKVQFTASAELRDKLERLQRLMRAEVPSGDIAEILERAVTEKLERLEAKRFAKTSSPRKTLSNTDTKPASRHVPAAVRRAVHERDGGRCRFVDD
jgi:hypothetical protein